MRAKMVTIMDMDTGKLLDEFGQFAEEVMNASGLPQGFMEELGLQLVSAVGARALPPNDPEHFLDQMYRFQE